MSVRFDKKFKDTRLLVKETFLLKKTKKRWPDQDFTAVVNLPFFTCFLREGLQPALNPDSVSRESTWRKHCGGTSHQRIQ